MSEVSEYSTLCEAHFYDTLELLDDAKQSRQEKNATPLYSLVRRWIYQAGHKDEHVDYRHARLEFVFHVRSMWTAMVHNHGGNLQRLRTHMHSTTGMAIQHHFGSQGPMPLLGFLISNLSANAARLELNLKL